MNGILKKGAILILAIMVLLAMLVACDGNDGESSTSQESSSSSEETSSTPESSEESPSEEIVPVEQIEAFIELLDSNYTYTIQNNSSDFKKWYICDGSVQEFASMYDTRGAYTILEGGKTYSYTYDSSDAKWHKRDANAIDVNSLIVNKLTAAQWTAYDSDTGVFTGVYDGKAASAKIVQSEETVEFVITNDDGFKLEIYDIGATTITLPESNKIVDHTNTSSEPEPEGPSDDGPSTEEPPAAATKNIYTVSNGKYDFDIVLLRDVLEIWLKGENQWERDVVGQRTLTSGAETQNVVYVNAFEEGIDFGVQYTNNGKWYFRNFTITDTVLVSGFANQTIKTREEFVAYLNSIAIAKINIGTLSATIDTEISDEDMEIITENIFNRLATIGTQIEGIDSQGTPIADLANAKVIKAFKSVTSSASAGAGLGNKRDSIYYYLAEIDGKIEFIMISVVATDHTNLNYYIINNTERRWLVAICERIPLEADNKDLWTVE